MSMNHCVFYRTDLKYDGRVSAIIRTLASSFPDEQIFLFEYPIAQEYYYNFPPNVKIIKSNLLFSKLKKSHIRQLLMAFEYALKSFFFLIKKKPRTIQVHHEIVILGPLLYKLFSKRVQLIYDDKEMYHIRDKNIPKMLYWLEYYLIKKSTLVISCNKYRARALNSVHQYSLNNVLIIENFVFKTNEDKDINLEIIKRIEEIKKNNNKILLHQGVIDKNRGLDTLKEISNNLDEKWVLCFIGVKEKVYEDFLQTINPPQRRKLYYIGYIDYNELNSFYKLIDACVIFYSSETFNNNFCAPNRLYAAVDSGKPIIVNSDNTTLNNFVSKYGNGIIYKDKSDLNIFYDNYEKYLNNSLILTNKYEYNMIIPTLIEFYKVP